jgi:hypothetical protein
MTESEWACSTDPNAMLAFLEASGRLSERKLRLFGAACCRGIWHLLADERLRRAVEVAELLADGQATEAETDTAGDAATDVAAGRMPGLPAELGWRTARAVELLLPLPEDAYLLRAVWDYVAVVMEGEQLVKETGTPEALDAWSEQSVESGRTMGWTTINPDAILADLLREVVGPLPFRRVSVAPALLRWDGGTVLKLAQGIYDEGTFDQLPILADSLEEAGCTDAAVLDHLRGPGPHCRGCWSVDLVLGKE